MSAELDAHNKETLLELMRSLERLARERIANGKAGMIGVRVPFRRGKFGEIHEINETVKQIRGSMND